MLTVLWWTNLALVAAVAGPAERVIEPEIIETRTVELTQTVTLHEVKPFARHVRLWVPIPSDAAWQRVLDRQVVDAPGQWTLVRQAEGRGDFLYVDVLNPGPGPLSVEVSCVVERQGVHFPIETRHATSALQSALFHETLTHDAPLMQVDDRVREIADAACGDETDPARQAMRLLQAVAEVADHYSKDPTKPHCGRGAASDCIDHGGGCCTDLHSLFIAMARYRGIPARMQYGYRVLDPREGETYDPGYRCWVEYFVPGAGWVPTDIVAADNDSEDNPVRWASLSSTRIWLWEGRSFDLRPKNAAGSVHTMICGWAEVDGQPIDPLPAEDGTPSKLRRTVTYRVLSTDRTLETPHLPQ